MCSWSVMRAIPEVEGTMGQLPEGAITLVETLGGNGSLVEPEPKTSPL